MKKFMIFSLCLLLLMMVGIFAFLPGILAMIAICVPILVPMSSMADRLRFSQKIFPRQMPYVTRIDKTERCVSWLALFVTLCFACGMFLMVGNMDRNNAGYYEYAFSIGVWIVAVTIWCQFVTNVLLYLLSHHSSYGYTIITHVILILLIWVSYHYFYRMMGAC